MTRAQVAVDMLCLSVNGIFEFKEGPTLEEVWNFSSTSSYVLVYARVDHVCP